MRGAVPQWQTSLFTLFNLVILDCQQLFATGLWPALMYKELSPFPLCILSPSSSWITEITRDGRAITSCWGLVVDLRSLLIFQAVFPQAWLALSPGQVSSLIAASQFRHDIAAMAFCHSIGEASAALLISRSLTWMALGFLLGMSFWNC